MRGDGEGAYLQVKHLLEVREGLTRNEDEVMLDKLFWRIVGGHDDLEERVDVLDVARDVAGVAAGGVEAADQQRCRGRKGSGRTRSVWEFDRPGQRRDEEDSS